MKNTILGVIGTILRFTLNIGIVVVSVYLVYHFTIYAYDFTRGVSEGAQEGEKTVRETQVEIPSGSTTQEVAKILYDAGLIGNVEWFRIQSRLDGMDGKFRAGTYYLNTSMANEEIMQTLAEGALSQEDMIKLTIPEGFTASQIGALLEEHGLCTAEVFRAAMNNSNFDYPFLQDMPIRNTRLEGYLFPDTYFVEEDATPDEIISKMLTRFSEVYDEESTMKSVSLGTDEIVIRASIIEAEIKVATERPVCASVIQNRLDIDMPLQMDATVLYGMGERKKTLLLNDLEIDSPYNTYKYTGLPVGPICNPGRDAIRAALNPSNTDFLYYVVNDLEIGSHVFTSDYESFLEEKEKYKNMQ